MESLVEVGMEVVLGTHLGSHLGRSDFLRFLCKITESRDVTSKITIVHKLPILSIRAWSGKMLDDRAQGPPMSPKPPLKC